MYYDEIRFIFSRIHTTPSFIDSQFVISGMSQIAALLLMYLIDEEDAFWALSQIMVDNKYAMHGKCKWEMTIFSCGDVRENYLLKIYMTIFMYS